MSTDTTILQLCCCRLFLRRVLASLKITSSSPLCSSEVGHSIVPLSRTLAWVGRLQGLGSLYGPGRQHSSHASLLGASKRTGTQLVAIS